MPLKNFLWTIGLRGSLVRACFRLTRRRIEAIPDGQVLWRVVYRVNQISPRTGEPKPSFFRDISGLSCDLAILTTQRRVQRGRPSGAGIRQFTAGNVRTASDRTSDVVHTPVRVPHPNYAHCEVHPALSGSRQKKMVDLSSYRVEPDLARLGDAGQR